MPEAGANARADTLRVVQPHVRMGDPHVCSDDRHRLSLLHACFEPLVRRAPGGRFAPALARDWSLAVDARHWTFELHRDARWADGAPVHAEDAAASLRRIRDDPPAGELGTSGVYQSYLRDCTIDAAAPHRLEVVTPTPMADLLDVLVELFILPADALSAPEDARGGSGAYRVAERDDARVTLERRADVSGDAPQRLLFEAVVDPDERAAAVAAGTAAIASDVAPRLDGLATHWQSSSVATTFMFELERGAGRDRRVRQALNLAVDVPTIVGALFAGRADPSASPCTPTQLGYDPDLVPYAHDPDAARRLLDEAGATDLSLVFDVPARLPDEAQRLGELLAEQFHAVGVSLDTVVHHDRPAYAEMVRDGAIHDAACFDSSPYSTFRLLREKFHSGVRGVWWLGYTDPELDALVDEAQTIVDVERRRDVYRRAARRLHEGCPWLYLYGAHIGWALAPEVEGWRPSSDGLVVFPSGRSSS